MNENVAYSESVMCDGNEAVASVAYRLNELVAIYPITPSSGMAELCDEWSAGRKPNLWGSVPEVVEMQSEAGVAGAIHGALLGGALTTTFTASQGLLLMIPNLYKIAGELLPFTAHVSARALAAHALSIFGDHQDVMACRATGCVLLCSRNVQEAQDLALVAQAACYRASLPFIHFFDGFRTSHEVAKIVRLTDEELRSVIDEAEIRAFRARALTPDRPTIRGTAQNPDVYFQGREAANSFYLNVPFIVQETMDRLSRKTGRSYRLFDYEGDPTAERVIVSMGSAGDTIAETVKWCCQRGEKLGCITVRLFQPFDQAAFFAVLPKTVQRIAVLDRTKEPGSTGEPLYLNVVAALAEAKGSRLKRIKVIGGRYGLGSKEFTPGMVRGIFSELGKSEPRQHFTVGIIDDVTGTSLSYDSEFSLEPPDLRRFVFVGLGSDGTVGANKSAIKIIGENTNLFAQGYFVYDSKKSGSVTVSHLRVSPQPIRAPYLIKEADFVACSQFTFVGRHDVLGYAAIGATLLLNSPFDPAGTWKNLPREWQETIIDKKLRVFVIDASRIARDAGIGMRTNTVLQTCFFSLTGVLPIEEAIVHLKNSIRKSYGKRGEEVVKRNCASVDGALAQLHEVQVPAAPDADAEVVLPPRHETAPEFVRQVTVRLLANEGDLLPVSAMPVDGSWPSGTARFEKRNLASEIPAWDPTLCIQCNKCVLVCPHAAIRAKFFEPSLLEGAPANFLSVPFISTAHPGQRYTLQVAPEDCTGCSLCVQVCPAKAKTAPTHRAIEMTPQAPRRAAEKLNWDFFLNLPDPPRTTIDTRGVKGVEFLRPLFEFSGACSGCGETPYLKLLTQLVGDRLVIANATGCSSIFGGNLPTTPYCANAEGRGPAWANSLFEDNAEFGFGLHRAGELRWQRAAALVHEHASLIGEPLVDALLSARPVSETEVAEQRQRIESLRQILRAEGTESAMRLFSQAEDLLRKSVWIVGGDGWAYDIGYGGLDHVLASGDNVRILVLDTEVYSNTGGQSSKATPFGAVARFAANGKRRPKKDLALMAMQYENVYVARVAFGAKDSQTVLAFQEAETFPGPALIIAYAHCQAHGFDLKAGLEHQKLAVDTGYWPLCRFDPRRAKNGVSPLVLDSAPPKLPLVQFTKGEGRFSALEASHPAEMVELNAENQAEIAHRYQVYKKLAESSAAGAAVSETATSVGAKT